MKRKFFQILLCLLLVLRLCPTAMAAALDTTDLRINDNVIEIGVENPDAVTEALSGLAKTAKIAVPYSGSTEVYVLKDNATVVPHYWGRTGYIQFEVPGAGTYVITEGMPATLEDQLTTQKESIAVLSDDVLTADHAVKAGTVIHANGHTIKGEGGSKTLSAVGSLTINNLNGMEQILLGAGDAITFGTSGDVTIEADYDDSVGYGSVKLTVMDSDGDSVTRTFFLTEGETLKISHSGGITGNETFNAGTADAEHPVYRVTYEAHDNTYVKGSSGKIVAECNGLYDYYTDITVSLKGSSTAQVLAEKSGDKDILSFSGVKVGEGSTVLTLDSDFLNTLSVGEYILTFHYADGGCAEGSLHIKQKPSVADETNPKTGDGILMVMSGMTLSAAALAVILVNKKEKNLISRNKTAEDFEVTPKS